MSYPANDIEAIFKVNRELMLRCKSILNASHNKRKFLRDRIVYRSSHLSLDYL
jgi:hypothetical protein